jgi:hypothetical protein
VFPGAQALHLRGSPYRRRPCSEPRVCEPSRKDHSRSAATGDQTGCRRYEWLPAWRWRGTAWREVCAYSCGAGYRRGRGATSTAVPPSRVRPWRRPGGLLDSSPSSVAGSGRPIVFCSRIRQSSRRGDPSAGPEKSMRRHPCLRVRRRGRRSGSERRGIHAIPSTQ